ncbi:MAG TPA: N-6 DNA methylase [Candidatus Saccharimonadales bacterium]|nr:N-6 DNA methylase [Candidatus Saccharimonadales bacterium]
MPPKKKNGANSAAPMTTSQMLGSLLKSARDIMRKDKGLNGDLDRLPLLTWIMFLKFLDDLEQQREEEAALAGKKFKPAIEAPYRWRDWAADPQGITGDELLAFINNDEARRADGKKGAGLFAYLRSLSSSNGDNRRDVIARVFKGVDNRMKSGYLLRDIINKVAAIHFTSSDELHTLGALYESMLREMRDAAGDSGEFYTPRAVVRFMVEVTDPRLGETVLDPASGTGGFLVEAYNHLEKQVQTVADRKRLQTETINGCEPKSLPYLLCQMNLLLHGLDAPQIDPDNALRFKLSEIGEKERVDVILTNPPFGGEEEKGIQGNFPEDRKTSETALLFLQLIMRKLKRQQTGAKRPARAAVVVPNGTLYASGVAERIRRDLLSSFNLHTIVRLPKGVFEPYADIPTNMLFFDTSGPTKEVWFYAHPLPPKRAAMRAPSYSQTEPLVFEEFLPLLEWWDKRKATDQAWCVDPKVVLEDGCSLDLKNPNERGREFIDLRARSQNAYDAAGRISRNALKLVELGGTVERLSHDVRNRPWNQARLGDLCSIVKGKFPTMKTQAGPYPFVVTAAMRKTADAYQFDGAAVCIPLVSSTGHGHAALHRIHFETGKFAVASIMAALIVRDETQLLPKFLYYYLWRHKDAKLVTLMAGTANTSLTLTDLEGVLIEFPELGVQQDIVTELESLHDETKQISSSAEYIVGESQELILDAFHSLL